MISEPMVRLVQTAHLACTNSNSLQTDQNKIPHDPRQLGVPSGASKMISKPVVRLAQTMHISCIKISVVSKQTDVSIH
jgi:hypothetical protein